MYRFCEANDGPLLTEAYRRCLIAGAPDLDALARAIQLDLKHSIVALHDDAPIGFLLAATRKTEALVYRLAVHPDHARRGHGRSMLAALSTKLAAGGVPRVVAEVPEDRADACALFDACGFTRDGELTDYALDPTAHAPGASGAPPDDSFLVAITLDDVLADPLLGGIRARAWGRSEPALVACKPEIAGLALAALNAIAGFVLYRKLAADSGTEIVAIRSLDDEDGEAAVGCLIDSMLRRVPKPLVVRAMQADEIDPAWLATWGFRPRRTFVRMIFE